MTDIVEVAGAIVVIEDPVIEYVEVGIQGPAGAFLSFATAPAYVKGGLYFDTALNKLRVGGATAWETVTSV